LQRSGWRSRGCPRARRAWTCRAATTRTRRCSSTSAVTAAWSRATRSPEDAAVRLKRIGVAAVLAWAVTAGAQPTVPGEHALHHLAPAANASQAGVTLAEAVDAAWRRSTQSAEAAGAERRARAQRTVASSLLPAPPALE